MKKTIAILLALLFLLQTALIPAAAEGETASDVPVLATTDEVAAFIRKGLVARKTAIRFKADKTVAAGATLARVCANTGNGAEGDYLRLALNYVLPKAEQGADDVYTLRPTYYTTAAQEAVVDAYVKSVVAGCTAQDDTEKARYLYDYLCEHVTFDLENLYNDEDLLKYTAYGAVVNGRAVCQGFATLYYKLALAAGLHCRIVTGQRGDVAHAWNIIEIGEQWYHVDASSGAQLLDNSAYFMKRLFDGYTIRYGEKTAPEIQGYLFEIANEGESIRTGTLNNELNYGSNDSIVWQLNTKTGALIISGTGAMPSILFQNGTPFWNNTSIKSAVISEGITNIADYLFNGCSNLAEISIPSTVTSIGSTSFAMCPIESIYLNPDNPAYSLRGECLIHIASKTLLMGTSNSVIPNDGSVENITTFAFYGCSALKTIALPDSLKSITEAAFCDCTGLTEIQFPSNLTTIGGSAFNGCTGLTEIQFPSGLTTIGNAAFKGCTGLAELRIPSGITRINAGSFEDCTGLKTVSFADWKGQDLDISDRAFYGCTGLTKVNLPQGVKSINNYSFAYCTNLTELSLPKTVNKIESNAFDHCGKLRTITVDSENPRFLSRNNCLINTETKELIAACYNSVIPDDGSVIKIGLGAFSGCEELTSIIFPESIKQICGFNDCIGLTEVTIPGNVNRLLWAFQGCTGLTKLNILPGEPLSIDDSFNDCTALETLSFPDRETSIRGFSGCTNLTEVIIPSSVTSIMKAFHNCTNLANVNLSEGLVKLSGFSNCTKLTSISIPKTEKEIGYYSVNDKTAFDGCSGLTSVEFPDEVKQIYGFSNCQGITSITIPKDATDFYAFKDCYNLKTVTILSRSFRYAIYDTLRSAPCTIYGFANSSAETLAKEKNRPFIPLCSQTNAPHNTQPVDVTEPDCLNPGYTAGTVCVDCGEWVSGHEQTAEPLGHALGEPAPENVVAATCTTEGSYDSVTYCTRCGKLLSSTAEKIAMTPHSDNDRNGYCDDCEAYICEHPETSLQNAKAASCLENGYSGDTVCGWCGLTVTYGVTLPALGHQPEISRPAIAATCLDPGRTAEYTCSACGVVTVEAQSVPISTHVDSDRDGLCDVCLAPPDCMQYGRCGNELLWYVKDGVLVISGSGASGEVEAAPWESCADVIDCVYLRDSVTAMDGAPFDECPNIQCVIAADTTTVSRCAAPVLYYADSSGAITLSGRDRVPEMDLPALVNAAGVLCIDKTVASLCFTRLSLHTVEGEKELVYDILKNGKIIDEKHFRLPDGTALNDFNIKPLGYKTFNRAFNALQDNPDRNLILSISCKDLLPESLKADSGNYTEQFVLHFIEEPQEPEQPEKPHSEETPKSLPQQIIERFQATLAAILSVFKKLFRLFKKK
ncbi:MAG: leucine-rich repeat protein [Clostridia bacterium]|nr:leucine-rich repeat protein [Clostridia bacterium]